MSGLLDHDPRPPGLALPTVGLVGPYAVEVPDEQVAEVESDADIIRRTVVEIGYEDGRRQPILVLGFPLADPDPSRAAPDWPLAPQRVQRRHTNAVLTDVDGLIVLGRPTLTPTMARLMTLAQGAGRPILVIHGTTFIAADIIGMDEDSERVVFACPATAAQLHATVAGWTRLHFDELRAGPDTRRCFSEDWSDAQCGLRAAWIEIRHDARRAARACLLAHMSAAHLDAVVSQPGLVATLGWARVRTLATALGVNVDGHLPHLCLPQSLPTAEDEALQAWGQAHDVSPEFQDSMRLRVLERRTDAALAISEAARLGTPASVPELPDLTTDAGWSRLFMLWSRA